ncbi:outer membrane beta-barrel protein [Cysteiniphilum sp. QT6929]|uniref:outer membrane beta-barrel protein n=1 Tax=Cysteiniphilum sp. QT6929 TaxID=2975055 RepID=UPI0024B335E5|nr:outer membrane beta-barrel protein [Cysteiniphilum sp. QT6929]WHN66489.1 outer membrane beta-barrel protein [Cysteiniphilum sp. QT6929]
MKKLLLSATIGSVALSSIAFANLSNEQNHVVLSGEISANATPKNTFNSLSQTTSSGSTTNGGGLGFGAYIGYDYTILPSYTLGVKTGVNYLDSLNKADVTSISMGSATYKLNMLNIPILLTAKKFFAFGLVVGVEAGAEVQRWTIDISHGSDHDSKWNLAPRIGAEVGYQWQNGLSVAGNLRYVFGKSTDTFGDVTDNDALAYYSMGVTVSYTLPF